MEWIRGEFRKDLLELPAVLREMASFYLQQRILILPTEKYSTHPKYGVPMPYVVFWFADALGLRAKQEINNLALSLMYANTFYCIRDDLIDGRKNINGRVPDEHEHIALANFFFTKYLEIFKQLFPPESPFWFFLMNSINDWWEHEYWSYLFDRKKGRHPNPLSETYVANSSRYMVGITAPSVIAIALMTGNEERIPQIRRFLVNYFMGYRLADDMRDWEEDLQTRNYNRSTVIHLAIALQGIKEINDRAMVGFFLDKKFRRMLYRTIKKHYLAAKNEVSDLNSVYLNKFIDTQISYFQEEDNYYSDLGKKFENSVKKILEN